MKIFFLKNKLGSIYEIKPEPAKIHESRINTGIGGFWGGGIGPKVESNHFF